MFLYVLIVVVGEFGNFRFVVLGYLMFWNVDEFYWIFERCWIW